MPKLTHYWSPRRGGTDHSWVELADEALDTILTVSDEPVVNVMRRTMFRREHRVVQPRRWDQ